ncbi:MAG: acyltransferase [Acidobacteria bacterium]|nr:acyltransferase [Acidobacteriota bacterium]
MPLLSSAPFEQLRPWWYSPSQWVGNLTLTETWRHYFFGSPRVHFPGQAWTLCYEEQFYFVTGLLLLTLRKRFFAGVAAVSAITLVIATTCAWIGVSVDGFFFDGAWLMFAAGVAVYYRLHHASTSGARAIDMLLVTAVLASSLSPYRLHCSPFGFAFAAGLPWRYRFDRLSSASLLRPVLSCGRMCYSLYLVHQIPVKGLTMALYLAGFTSATATLFLAVPLSIGLSVALGWVFFELVERRFLNTPATTVPMPTAPVGALLSAGG